jgi:hypothetical protein
MPEGKAEENKIIIDFDTRKRDYRKMFQLKRGVKIHWINERTFEVQELSAFAWPIVYRITTADGYYQNGPGERVYFTPQIAGLSTQRKVSDVVLRLGVFLSIIAGLGSRQASWLMQVLFQVEVSKSAIDRWIDEVANALPSSDEMIELLHQQKPITQGHLDEIFPLGTESCVLVLKDEHGRIVTAQEIKKRDEEHVKPFLERLKRLGLELQTFYTDHCDCLRQRHQGGLSGSSSATRLLSYPAEHLAEGVGRVPVASPRCESAIRSGADQMVRRETEKDGHSTVEESLRLLQIRSESDGQGERDSARGSPNTAGDVVPARLSLQGVGDF